MALAGGFQRGDLVVHHGLQASVMGPPARAAAARISVGIRYQNGTYADVRVSELSEGGQRAVERDAGPMGPPSDYGMGRQTGPPSEYSMGRRPQEDRFAQQPVRNEAGSGFGNASGYGNEGYGNGNRSLEMERDERSYRDEDRESELDARRAPRAEADYPPLGRSLNFDEEEAQRTMQLPDPDRESAARGEDGERVVDNLAYLDEALTELENAVQTVHKQGREGQVEVGEARSELAKIEAECKQLEASLDSLAISGLPPARAAQAKDFKGDLLARLDGLFGYLEDLFGQLPPAAAAEAVRAAPAPAGGAGRTISNADSPPPRSVASAGGYSRQAPSSRGMVDPRTAYVEQLAGGFQKGDRVAWNGMTGTVVGRAARAACAAISVAVRDDAGSVADVRVAGLSLLD